MDARSAREASPGATALSELGTILAAENGLLAPHVMPDGADSPLAALAAAGERASVDPAGYAFVIEAVREGYLLHYRRPRILAGVDADLALLAGDYLYALGLGRLAAIGDPAAVAELADLISISAMLEAERAQPATTDAFWIASALAMGSGGSDEHEEAKREIRATASGDGVRELAEGAANSLAERLGLGLSLAETAEAIHFDEQSDEGGVHA